MKDEINIVKLRGKVLVCSFLLLRWKLEWGDNLFNLKNGWKLYNIYKAKMSEGNKDLMNLKKGWNLYTLYYWIKLLMEKGD
jgi:hypothetical protein